MRDVPLEDVDIQMFGEPNANCQPGIRFSDVARRDTGDR